MTLRPPVEFGDFQTPDALAQAACRLLARLQIRPASLVEPTCGVGRFLQAGAATFDTLQRALGLELQPEHADQARRGMEQALVKSDIPWSVRTGDVFQEPWPQTFAELPEPVLVLGNPPWVTAGDLGAVGADNGPKRSNFDRLPGLAAMTGKSNFDLAEAVLRSMLSALAGRRGWMAMLCKTSVARRLLAAAWRGGFSENRPCRWRLHRIDSPRWFQAQVDACLLIADLSGDARDGMDERKSCPPVCPVFEASGDDDDPFPVEQQPATEWGWVDGRLTSNAGALRKRGGWLTGKKPTVRWRSGVKHDCAAVLELKKGDDGRLVNGLGETVDVEPERVFPLLKSSDVANGRPPRRWLLAPQIDLTQSSETLAEQAPKTWRYLRSHAARFARRSSAVYRGRPEFAIFGVGDYTFAPAKAAASGFYSTLRFTPIGLHEGRPVLVDDTCYFLPCPDADAADELCGLLNAPEVRQLLTALTFPDSKRPLTAEILHQLDLSALSSSSDSPFPAPRVAAWMKSLEGC